MAFAVAVKVILSLFRKEFDGSLKALSLLHRPVKPRVRHLRFQKIGLPSQFRRRMRIRIGNELKAVQGGELPVHRRIRRKPCLHGVNTGRQILKAFFNRFKFGKCPEHGKMRRPDMRRNKDRLPAHLQRNFQQIPAVKAKDRAAV